MLLLTTRAQRVCIGRLRIWVSRSGNRISPSPGETSDPCSHTGDAALYGLCGPVSRTESAPDRRDTRSRGLRVRPEVEPRTRRWQRTSCGSPRVDPSYSTPQIVTSTGSILHRFSQTKRGKCPQGREAADTMSRVEGQPVLEPRYASREGLEDPTELPVLAVSGVSCGSCSRGRREDRLWRLRVGLLRLDPLTPVHSGCTPGTPGNSRPARDMCPPKCTMCIPSTLPRRHPAPSA